MSKKMKLIPHLEYDKLITARNASKHSENSAYVSKLSQNQAAASELLNWDSISDDIKLALFNSAMKGLREKFVAMTQAPILVEVSEKKGVHNNADKEVKVPAVENKVEIGTMTTNESGISNLVYILPEKLRSSASKLLHILENSKAHDMSWDSSGQISFRGENRRRANIIELLSYVLKPPSKTKPPLGLASFIFVLKKLKAPPQLFGIHIRKKLSMTLSALSTKKTPIRFPTDAYESSEGQVDEEENEDEGEEWVEATNDTPVKPSQWKSFK